VGEQLVVQIRRAIRARHYSRRTEEAYVRWVRGILRFHKLRHPSELGSAEASAFLTHLAVQDHVSVSTQNQALAALLFLYREVLGGEIGWLDGLVRAKRPQSLPEVLSRAQVRVLLDALDGTPRLVATLLYGGGLRLTEALRLRGKDLEFGARRIVVRDTTGGRARVTTLPESAVVSLRTHLRTVVQRAVRQAVRAAGLGVRSPADFLETDPTVVAPRGLDAGITATHIRQRVTVQSIMHAALEPCAGTVYGTDRYRRASRNIPAYYAATDQSHTELHWSV
jgi:integrase